MASNLGLRFEDAFLARNLRMTGEVEGFPVLVDYTMTRTRTWEGSRSKTRHDWWSRVRVEVPGLAKDYTETDPEDGRYTVREGAVVYSPLTANLEAKRWNAWRWKHFTSAPALEEAIRRCLGWAKRLARR